VNAAAENMGRAPRESAGHPPESVSTVADRLQERFGEQIVERTEFRGDLTLSVAPEAWLDVMTWCRDDPSAAFDQLDCLMGDHLPERTTAPLAVVAHLVSHTYGHRLRVKTALVEGRPLPSVTGLWPSAGFDEREAWEMFGIVFEGHPDLRRLLTTEDFEGFPMRKDFPIQGTVGGRVRTDLRGKI
jgi:NADH-quinone oxidoreductase subunit C